MTICAQDFHGMSDDALKDERTAQQLVERVRAMLLTAAYFSDTKREAIEEAINCLPNQSDWNEAIAEARRIEA